MNLRLASTNNAAYAVHLMASRDPTWQRPLPSQNLSLWHEVPSGALLHSFVIQTLHSPQCSFAVQACEQQEKVFVSFMRAGGRKLERGISL